MQPLKKQLPSQLHIILAVWGQEYCDNFLYKNLCTRLTSNGLRALNQALKVIYKIYAPTQDLDYIQKSEPFKRLSQTLNVELVPIQINQNDKSAYKIFSKIHDLAILEAYQCNAGMMFDSPDAIYGSSFFANLLKLIQSGYRLVLAPGLNLALEDVYQSSIFNEKILNQDNYADKDLISLALEYPHPERALKRFYHRKIPILAASLFWQAHEKNFFQQAFHTHPMYIYPEKQIRLLCQTIDYGEFLFNACPTKKYHYFANNQDLVFFELSKKTGYQENGLYQPSPFFFLLWSHSFAHKYQSYYFPRRKHYSLSIQQTPFNVTLKWWLFSVSFFLLKKFPLWVIKPFLFSVYKKINQTPKLKFTRYLRKEFLWNYYEANLRQCSKNYPIEDIVNFIENNKNKIRIQLFTRHDFFSHLSFDQRCFFVDKLKVMFPQKYFKKKLSKYLRKLELNSEKTGSANI